MTTQTPQNFDTPSGTYAGSELAPETARPTGQESTTGTGSGQDASVKDRAVAVGGTVKDEAAGVAGEVTSQARDLMGQARGQVREQVSTQRGRAADLVQGFADDLEKMAGSSDTFAGSLAGQAADQVRALQQYLRTDANPLDDLGSFARRRPGTFLLGALAAGILVGRATRGTVAARQQGEQRELGQVVPARTVGPTYTDYSSPASTPAPAYSGYPAQTAAPAPAYTDYPGQTQAPGYTGDYPARTQAPVYPAGTAEGTEYQTAGDYPTPGTREYPDDDGGRL